MPHKLEKPIVSREFYISGPRHFEERTRTIDEVPEGYALIRINSVTICGSERKYWVGNPEEGGKQPGEICLGHEASGVVVDLDTRQHYKHSEEGRWINLGDTVALDPLNSCDTLYPPVEKCYVCREDRSSRNAYCTNQIFTSSTGNDGFTREHVLYPLDLLIHLPNYVPRDLTAMVEPLAVGLRAFNFLKRKAKHYCEDTGKEFRLDNMEYAIIGDGSIGVIVAHSLAHYGSIPKENIHLFGVNPKKLNLAKGFSVTHDVIGFDGTNLDACLQSISEFYDGFDLTFECVGHDQGNFTVRAGEAMLKREGVLIQMGMGEGDVSLPLQDGRVRGGKTIVGVNKTLPEDMVDIAQQFRLAPYVSLIRGMLPVKHVEVKGPRDVEAAYQLAEDNSRNQADKLFLKVMMDFNV